MEPSDLERLSACPICASTFLSPALLVVDRSVSQELFHLVDCRSCGFRFTNPRPAANDLDRFYQSDDYISHSNASRTVRDRLYQSARRWTLERKLRLIRRYEPSGRVLDVGCGTGEFLALLKSQGYLVRGVEPSDKARKQAIANHALAIVPVLDAVPHLERFQVVTLWHVLEHLPDPHETLKKLFVFVSDGGLLILAVPDRASWDAWYYGSDWAAWDVPRHLSHFCQFNIHALLREHGFEIVRTKRMWLDALYVAILSEGHRGRGAFAALVFGACIGAFSNLVALVLGRPASSSLYIARKTAP